MKFSPTLFILAVSFLWSYGLTAQGIISDSISAQLRLGIQGFQERYHSPSIAVAIVHGDQLIFSDAIGFTDLENRIPATVDSKYQIHSITKMFTATMLMQLWEQGRIDLDGDIKEYVPEYLGADGHDDNSATTFLDLATHNSGLPRNSPADVLFAKQVDKWLLTKEDLGPVQSASREEFIRALQFVNKGFPEYQYLSQDNRNYSNLGYGLLGLGMERAAGIGYEEYILSRICRPLGLSGTGFGTFSSEEHTIAKGYYYADEVRGFVRAPDYYPNSMVYAGGMFSTASDLARFISSQFDQANPVISGKSIRMMQRLGIGWLRPYPYVVHEGSMLGGRSQIILHPKLRVGWVILTNTTDFQFNRINEYIADLILPLFAEKPIADLQKYAGTYTLEGDYDSLTVYMKDGELYSSYLEDSLPDQPLVFSGDNSLKATGYQGHEIYYRFIVGSDSEIKSLILNQLRWVRQ